MCLDGGRRTTQLMRDPLGGRQSLIGGNAFIKSALLECLASPREVTEVLRRASTVGATTDLNSQLRAVGIDTLHFALASDGMCRITSPGFEIRGFRGNSVAVEGRLRLLDGSSAHNRPLLELKLVPTRKTLVGDLIWPCLVLGLLLWREDYHDILANPTGFLLFFLLVGFLAPAFHLLRTRALIRRIWPGLLTEAQHFANGSFQLPAA